MKTLLPALTVFLAFCFSASAQSPFWLDAYNANKSGTPSPTCFTIDKDGNAYHGGTFTGTAGFDTASLKANSTDGYLVKTTPGGDTRWAVKLGGSNLDDVWQVATDDSNNVYVTGRFLGNFNIQGVKKTGSFSYSSYLVKLDSSGTLVWVKYATGTSLQQATSVKVDSDYNVYWYGQYFGTSTIAGKTVNQAGGSYDLFLAKIAPGGNTIKVAAYGGFSSDFAFNLALNDKNVFISGRFFNSITIDTSTVTGSGGYDIFVAKLDTSLRVVWARSAGGNSTDDITAMNVNDNGEIVIAGTFASSFSLGSRSLSGGFSDNYVGKISANGAGLWLTKMGGGSGFSPSNFIRNAYIDQNGAVIVGGYHTARLTIGSSNYNPSGGSDIMVVQYNKNGAFVWINRGGGNNTDIAAGMEIGSEGYYYVGGYYQTKSKFGKENLSGSASSNLFVATGTPPVETPNFRRLRTQYVYVDSTYEKSFDLNLKSSVTYQMLKGPTGATFDASDATITYTPKLADIGSYWVVLSAENLGGKDVDSFQIQVIIPLKAELALPETGCVGRPLAFEQADKRVGPLTVIWDFGDGNSSVEEEDQYSYSSEGQYIVKMYVANALNVTDSLSDTIQIEPLPKPDFDISHACIKDTLRLSNKSTLSKGSITGYEWLENDISISTADSLKRYRDTAGAYNYSLVATSAVGCKDTLTKFVRVTPKPVAGFITYNTCEEDDALFFDLSTAINDTIDEYSWDFGDGTVATVDYPGYSHRYTKAGTYTASLSTTTKNGCRDTFITSIPVNEKPIANFSASDLCLGQVLDLSDQSTTPKGVITQRRWSTGDGKSSSQANLQHTYKTSGQYEVSLVSVNSLGCVDTFKTNITVTQKPKVGFSNTLPCIGQNAIFQDTSRIGAKDTKIPTQWYLDGTLQSTTGDFLIETITSATPITVKMILSTAGGCLDSIEKSLTPKSPVTADFSLGAGCEGDTVPVIENLDTNALASTQWVGNGIDVFKANGKFFAHLKSAEIESKLFLRTYAKNGCEDSISYTTVVHPTPSPDFTYIIDTLSKKVRFESVDKGTNTFIWDFDNGTAPVALSSRTIDGTFNVNKSYNINLQVVSDQGCSSEKDSMIFIGFPNSIDGVPAFRVALYPNPAQDVLHLDLGNATIMTQAIISDVNGQEVLRARENTIDVSSLSEGVYFISIEVEGMLSTGRFVKR